MTSVLDQMTKGVMERKEQARTTLTPVGTEKGGPLAKPSLPNDLGVFMSNEALSDHAASLRKFAEDALRIAEAIDVMLGREPALTAAAEAAAAQDQKAIEREADRRAADREKAAAGDKRAEARVAAEKPLPQPKTPEEFKEHLTRITAEAQAAVFGDADTPAEPEPARPTVKAAEGDGWECPKHGAKDLVVLKSKRRNVDYRACKVADCGQFERA